MNLTTKLSPIWRVIRRIAQRFHHDHCETNAAALSFTTLLALVPLAALAFSTLSLFPVFEDWARDLENFIYENLIPTAGDFVREHVQQFTEKTGRLTAFGILFLVFSAILLLLTIEETLNKIWGVEDKRSLVQKLVNAWTILTLGPLLIGASLSLSSYFITSSLVGGQVAAQARSALLSVLPFLFQTLAFLLLYSIVPNCRVRLHHALIGGVVAALLFELTKKGFTVFVLDFGNYEVIYGAVASIPIFFVWVYLSWLVVLFGAEVAATLSEFEQSESGA